MNSNNDFYSRHVVKLLPSHFKMLRLCLTYNYSSQINYHKNTH